MDCIYYILIYSSKKKPHITANHLQMSGTKIKFIKLVLLFLPSITVQNSWSNFRTKILFDIN